jgi:hypothetical protein
MIQRVSASTAGIFDGQVAPGERIVTTVHTTCFVCAGMDSEAW